MAPYPIRGPAWKAPGSQRCHWWREILTRCLRSQHDYCLANSAQLQTARVKGGWWQKATNSWSQRRMETKGFWQVAKFHDKVRCAGFFLHSSASQKTKVLHHDPQQNWNEDFLCALKSKALTHTSVGKALKKKKKKLRMKQESKVTATQSDTLTFYQKMKTT